MNHFQLPVFNISKVNVTLLSSYIIKQFLDFNYLSKLMIRFTHVVFFIYLGLFLA